MNHGDHLKIGSTTFLVHIHQGNETCDDCEPGQVMAQLKAKESEDEGIMDQDLLVIPLNCAVLLFLKERKVSTKALA